MHEVTNQDLMVFVVLGFCTGVFVSFYLTRLLEVVHTWRLFHETLVHIILMCVSLIEDVEFIRELKRKGMREAEMSAAQIHKFEEVDERTLTNWKNSVILSLVAKAPPRFRSMMPFKTWQEAVHFMNDAFRGNDQ